MGRDAVRLRRAQARRQGLGNGDHRVLPRPPGQVQGAAGGGLRRAAEDLHGQDPEVPAARESKVDERHRYMSAVPQAREPLLLRDERDAICTLTMNRPQQMNLLTSEMLDALQSAFDSLVADRKIRDVVLAGAGKILWPRRGLQGIRALEEQPEI